MEVRNATGWVSQQQEAGRIHFRGTGKPIIAEWKKQGRSIRALTIDGVVRRGSRGELLLDSAALSGSIVVVQEQPSSNVASKTPQFLHLGAESARYDAAKETWELDGGVGVRQVDEGAMQQFALNGRSATIAALPRGTKGPAGSIGHADMAGPVTFSMRSSRTVPDPQNPSKPIVRSQIVEGRADRAIFDSEKKTVRLVGNVSISGDDPVVLGEVTATSAVLTLDDRGRPMKLELEGDPGRTTLKSKRSGGFRTARSLGGPGS